MTDRFDSAVKAIAAAVMIAALSLGLAGCGQELSFLGAGGEEHRETVVSADIFVPIEKIRSLNPVIAKDEDAYYIDKLIYDGLFKLDGTLAAVPSLAESFEYGDGGDSMTIHLRRGVLWHDGEAFHADDVKFSIESYMSVLSSNQSMFDGFIQNIRSVKVKDDYTVVLNFRDSTAVSASKLTFPILPKHQFKNVSAVRKTDESFVPVGTGPYRVEQVDPAKGVTLSGNAGYFGGVAPQNTMHFKILQNKMDAINLFEVNDYNIVFSKDLDRDTLLKNKDVNLVSFPSNEVEFLGFNSANPALANAKVRQALASAIDTKAIIETAYFNSGIQNDNIYFPNYLGVDSKEKLLKMDLDAAKTLLSEGGYIDRDGDGFVEDINGEEIFLTLLVNGDSTGVNNSRNLAAQLIHANLSKLPIHVTLDVKEWNAYLSALNSGRFDLYIGGYKIEDSYDLRFLLKSGRNPINYSNEKLDALLDQMESGISAEERKEAFIKVKRILNEDMPYFCLLYKSYGAIASTTVQGLINPYFHNLYNGCEAWSIVMEKTD